MSILDYELKDEQIKDIDKCNLIFEDEYIRKEAVKLTLLERKENSIGNTYSIYTLIISLLEADTYSFSKQMPFQMYSEEVTISEKLALEKITNNTNSFILKARLQDILWVKARHNSYGSRAISYYITLLKGSQIDEEWMEPYEWVVRALSISQNIKAKAQKLQDKEEIINIMQDRASSFPSKLSLSVCEYIVEEIKLDARIVDSLQIILDQVISRAIKLEDFSSKRDALHILGKAYKRNGNLANTATYNMKEAFEILKMLIVRKNEMEEIKLLREAIEILESIPKDYSTSETSEVLNGLYLRLGDVCKICADEMKPIRFKVCTDEDLLSWQAFQKGRTIEECAVLLGVFLNPLKDEIYHEQRNKMRGTIRSLVTRRFLDAEGKIQAVVPHTEEGLLLEAKKSLCEYSWAMKVVYVQEVFLKHIKGENLDYRNFIDEIVRTSPFVSEDRRISFSKGLVSGFEGDFIAANYILVPQIENSLRRLLHHNDIPTYRFVEDRMEVISLGSMLIGQTQAVDCIRKILGADLCIDLATLYVEKIGQNYRNELSHGRLNDESFDGVISIYSWARILLMVFLPTELSTKAQGALLKNDKL